MVKKLVFFRCDGSLQIGTGHVMRCICLATALEKKGYECIFVTNPEAYEIIDKLKVFSRFNPEDFFIKKPQCDLLVIDNYSLNINYEKNFQNSAKKILVIDDLADREHFCDILIDQNLGTRIEDYKNLVNENCKILVGSEYCILREEFSILRSQAEEKRKQTKQIKKILINFGGNDLDNHCLKALGMVEQSNFCGEIDVVLGFNSLHLSSISDFAKKSKNKINIHYNANMAQMILEADLAIAAGGTSTWERLCLLLPTYLIKIADNQEKTFATLGKNISFGEFFEFANNNYQKEVSDIKNIIDGNGVNRLVDFL
jgi:UDP-2,4-diacetamido-2,4,6-trideoxy-beta-L-altropyranose hydrolase